MMKNDSLSASSKIRELFDLHKSGRLSDEEYRNQLKPVQSWIINQLKIRPLTEPGREKESIQVSKKDIGDSSIKFKKDEYDMLKSEIINKDDAQPAKERVEKILWRLLN
jgi:hypothetical protein